MKKVILICLLSVSSLVWAYTASDDQDAQWKLFKNHGRKHIGEKVIWKMKVNDPSASIGDYAYSYTPGYFNIKCDFESPNFDWRWVMVKCGNKVPLVKDGVVINAGDAKEGDLSKDDIIVVYGTVQGLVDIGYDGDAVYIQANKIKNIGNSD